MFPGTITLQSLRNHSDSLLEQSLTIIKSVNSHCFSGAYYSQTMRTAVAKRNRLPQERVSQARKLTPTWYAPEETLVCIHENSSLTGALFPACTTISILKKLHVYLSKINPMRHRILLVVVLLCLFLYSFVFCVDLICFASLWYLQGSALHCNVLLCFASEKAWIIFFGFVLFWFVPKANNSP